MRKLFCLLLLIVSTPAISGAVVTTDKTKPNLLIKETSPYLLQHAYNPVNWYPWGEPAFKKAREENKPVLISIGYSTCHWCHVMARESFENKAIADLLNKHFVSIKVDREERPDIDRIYITASEILAGYGGWPTTIIATPSLKPFFAATYMPPVTTKGHEGFKELLEKVIPLWQQQQSRVIQTADEISVLIQQQLAGHFSPGTVKADSITKAYQHFQNVFDGEFGGFGNAPKFPRTAVFDFLLQYGKQFPKADAHNMVEYSLDHITRAGITDLVGGGFHRYAVDAQWQVPHFEKMLYDQGLIINTLVDASNTLNTRKYFSVIREALDFTLTEMHDTDGGFYSAFDADSTRPDNPKEHGEGAYYLWQHSELVKLLNNKELSLLSEHFNLMKGGNIHSDPQQEFTGLNILHAEQPLEVTASTTYQSAIRKLKQARIKRPRPHIDRKKITAWNALMVQALAKASSLLNDKKYLLHAEKTAQFIHRYLYNPVNKQLSRSIHNGQLSGEAFLDDYAYLTRALVTLYQHSNNRQWLIWAQDLMQHQLAIFHDKQHGGFFDHSGSDKNVLFRSKEIYDGALPSANAISVENLLVLSALLSKPEWKTLATDTMNAFHQNLNELHENYPQMFRSFLINEL